MDMETTESNDAVFEGWLERITNRRFGNDRQWCVLDGQSLAFYKNKRSSCLYCIELSKTQSVTSTEKEHQFEVKTTDKKYIYGTDSKELCDEWVKHISTALQKMSHIAVNGNEKKLEMSDHRRGSLPQQNTVKDAVKKHSSLYEKSSISESVHKQRPWSTSKEILERSLSNGSSTDDNVECVNRRPKSMGSKVKNLALRFSVETGQVPMPVPSLKSPTSPVSSLKSPTSPSRSGYPNVKHTPESSPVQDQKKETLISNVHKRNSDSLKENEERPDSGYSTLPDVTETPSQIVKNEDDEVVIQTKNAVNNDDGIVQEEVDKAENKAVLDTEPQDCSCSNADLSEELENTAVVYRKTNNSNMNSFIDTEIDNVSNDSSGTKSIVVSQQDKVSVPSAPEENTVVMRRKTYNKADTDDAPNKSSNAVDIKDDIGEEVVMRKPPVPSAPVIMVVEDEDDFNEQTKDEGNGVTMDDILDLKFDKLDENLPHSKPETHPSITSLKTLLLEIGGTALDGTFVRKSIDVGDLKPVQELSNLLQKLQNM